jgi:hypothetical protein
MKTVVRDSIQTMQRVKVGVIGLGTILTLIVLAALVFSVVSRERPGTAIGAANSTVAANLTMSNGTVPSDGATGEPLAELGVAPAATPSPAKR